jgi:hypothetical protein
MTCASLGFLKQRLLGSTSVLQALPAKPKRQHPRDSARSRRRPGAGGGLSTDLFRVEPLEPRLLLSADLAPHAQDAILTGLAHFTQDVQKLNTNTTADAHLPFINLPVANIANFGSLATTLQTAVGNYFAHSNTPTVNTQGLADALRALPATGGNVALSSNGTVETLTLSLNSNIDPAPYVLDLSGVHAGLDVKTGGNANIEVSGSRSLALSFSIDTANDSFSVASPSFKADISESGVDPNFNLKFGGVNAATSGATADLSATLAGSLHGPTGSGDGSDRRANGGIRRKCRERGDY